MKLLRKILHSLYYNLFLKWKLKKTVIERVGKFKFKVYPSVFNPCEFISSKVFASYIDKLELENKSILDMGCGSGIVSVFAASKGAECVAVDINPAAVSSAMENAELNGFKNKINVVEGDLFHPTPALPPAGGEETIIPSPLERVRVRHDIIFFNPPYYKGIPGNNFERAFKGGENYEVIYRFMKEAKKFLKTDGYICMIISSDMGIDELIKIAEFHGYSYDIVTKINKLFETFYIINLV